MTNLEKAGSLQKALERYPAAHELLNFKKWCTQEAAPTIPDWVKAGQWFKDTSDNTYNRITVVEGNIVECSNCDVFLLANFCTPNTDYVPVRIKPWTLVQVEKVMNSHQLLLLEGETVQITEVRRSVDSDRIVVNTDIRGAFATGYLAKNGETDDNQPCGTPVPL